VMDLFLELRAICRRLLRRPAYTLACVASIALGASATVVAYSLLDAVLLSPPPGIGRPSDLFRVSASVSVGKLRAVPFDALAFPQYLALREALQPTTPLGAYITIPLPFRVGGRETQSGVFLATHELFEVLELRPAFGRNIAAGDDATGAAPVAMISFALWQDAFHGSPTALGQSVSIRSKLYHIVGVLPPKFDGLDRRAVDIAVPLREAAPEIMGNRAILSQRRAFSFNIVGRSPHLDITSPELARRLTLAFRRNAVDGPELDPDAQLHVKSVAHQRIPRLDRVISISGWLLGLSSVMLLFAGVNVAILVATRGIERETELRTRVALGAPSSIVIRLTIIEALLVAIAGLLVAWPISWTASRITYGRVLAALKLPTFALSLTAVAAAAATTIVIAVCGAGLAGLILHRRLRHHGPLVSASRTFGRRGATEYLMPVTQIALTTLLTAAGSQFVGLMLFAYRAELGIDIRHLATVQLKAPITMAAEQRAVAYEQVAHALQSLPEVDGVALASSAPFGRRMIDMLFAEPPGRVPSEQANAAATVAGTAGLERVLGLKLIRGRFLAASDNLGSARVMVINQAMADVYWSTLNPLGRCLHIGREDAECTRVVGVVTNYRTDPVAEPLPEFYLPLAQTDRASVSEIVVRTHSDAASVQRELGTAIRGSMPSNTTFDLRPLTEAYTTVLAPWTIAAVTLLVLAAVSLIITMVGTYAMVSMQLWYERTSVAIRLAIGATPLSVGGAFVARYGALFAMGVATGTLSFMLARRLLATVTNLPVPSALIPLVSAVGFFCVASAIAMVIPVVTVLQRPLRRLLDGV